MLHTCYFYFTNNHRLTGLSLALTSFLPYSDSEFHKIRITIIHPSSTAVCLYRRATAACPMTKTISNLYLIYHSTCTSIRMYLSTQSDNRYLDIQIQSSAAAVPLSSSPPHPSRQTYTTRNTTTRILWTVSLQMPISGHVVINPRAHV